MTELNLKDDPQLPEEVNQITETALCDNTNTPATNKRVVSVQDKPPDISLFKLKTQVLASLSVSLGSMVVGFASAYSSPALASMSATNTTMTPTEQEESWIGSLMPLCAIIGGVVGGPLIEMIGRKTTILATALPFIASWLLIGLAVNIPMIYLGRSIAGICVGIASLCFPVYLGETLQPEVRGMLGLLPTTIGNIGMLITYVAGKYMNWSTLALFGATLPLPFLLLTFLIPETPRWYVSKNRDERAKKSLQWLRGKDADITSELAVIKDAYIEEQKNFAVSSFDMFKSGNLKLVAISLGLMFFQQMSGINALVFYSTSIFEGAGDSIDKFSSSIIMGVVNFGATFLASLLIDRLGRKVLLYISGSTMMVSLIGLGAYFYLKHVKYDIEAYEWLPLACIVTYITAFSFGYGPVPWLMMGEILPVKIRGASASIVTGFNWSFTFVVTKTFKDLNGLVGEHWTFWIFALMCFIGLFFVFFCVPETQGRTLDEIEKKFKGPPRARRMSSVANFKPLPMAM